MKRKRKEKEKERKKEKKKEREGIEQNKSKEEKGKDEGISDWSLVFYHLFTWDSVGGGCVAIFRWIFRIDFFSDVFICVSYDCGDVDDIFLSCNYHFGKLFCFFFSFLVFLINVSIQPGGVPWGWTPPNATQTELDKAIQDGEIE